MHLFRSLSRWSLVPILVAAAGCRQPNVFEPPPPPQVTVQRPVQRAVTLYDDFVGRTEASEMVEVRARVKGFLESIDFEPSQIVEVGDPLFEIEPESFLAAVAAAEAALAQAVAGRDLADATLQRAQTAYERQAVSELEMMERRAQLDVEAAGVKSREAALANAKLEWSYTTIVAPIKGRVSREYVTIGNLVGGGEATLLTTIVKDDPIFAYFNINERELLPYLKNRRKENEPRKILSARLQFSDGRDYEHEGQIDFADNSVDPLTGTIQVRGKFPNPLGSLIPGLFVRVLLPQDGREAMLVPELALQRDLTGSFLLVVNDESLVERRDVTLGPRVKAMRIIDAGLAGSERVIVRGLQRARPGITVVAEDADAGGAPEG